MKASTYQAERRRELPKGTQLTTAGARERTQDWVAPEGHLFTAPGALSCLSRAPGPGQPPGVPSRAGCPRA